MKYLLDTNVWVDYLNARYSSVVGRIQASSPREICLSSIVLAELRYGADKSSRKTRNHGKLDILAREVAQLDFDTAASRSFGRLRAKLERSGRPIGPYDMLIAAQAMSRGLILVSDNVDEFRRIAGLEIENWRDEGSGP